MVSRTLGVSLDNELWNMVDNKASMLDLDRSSYISKLVEDDLFRKPVKVFTIANLSAILLLIITIVIVIIGIQNIRW